MAAPKPHSDQLLQQYAAMHSLLHARPAEAVVPPAVHSDKPGTWSYDTINRRLREEILKRTFDENASFLASHPESLRRLQALDSEMAKSTTTTLRNLPECSGDDANRVYRLCVEQADRDFWNKDVLAKWISQGCTWASAPWLVSELFFYRRISHAFDHFATGHDPFEKQKLSSLRGCSPVLFQLSEAFSRLRNAKCEPEFKAALRSAVLGALEGNSADLSLWPCSHDEEDEAEGPETSASSPRVDNVDEMACLLADDFELFHDDLQRIAANREKERIAYFFIDNAGSEILSDMWLACILIEHAVVDKVVFYVKQYPIFVSDALPKDFDLTFQWMQQRASQRPELSELADRWLSYVKTGKWEVKASTYFCMPFEYSNMPKDLYEELRDKAAILISKGDANYRRILGDRLWPFDTPFPEVAGYMPCPLLALRKLKADIACGISNEKQKQAQESDPNWMVNGKWGVIHYFNPSTQGK
ncbi:duf89 fructose bisphosphatase [Cystoisospora suis]|uniref:Sugar phosphate phosphatase n=1 Tax=Cystoisospora suis TaxID=483139 RepID=A0A2C6LAN1_9APIC|nr:duf89 fructose bisphosphatase [Cystoisospora suis]